MNAFDDTRQLAERALEHLQSGTTDQADAHMPIPVGAYLDEARFTREVQSVFHNLPIAAALSIELPDPGTYVAQTILDTPLLLTRGEDGLMRAHLNVCRHRGATLCPDGRGRRSRFACPYHAWTYDNTGALVKLYGDDKFGDFDHSTRGLTPLACAERNGLIFVCLTPGTTFDIDRWLTDMTGPLSTLDLDHWVLFEQRDLRGPGWKVAMDGYLEVYHHDIVHRSTVGQHTIGNLLVHDTFGPHQRLTFGRKNLSDLADTPRTDWRPDEHIRIIHSVFPNLSISGIVGGHCLVSQIFPGATIDETITRQSILCAPGDQDDAWLDAAETFSRLTLEAVRDEDYAIGQTVQSALRSGANTEFLLGLNEPAVQHYHKTVAHIMNADADELRTLGVSRCS